MENNKIYNLNIYKIKNKEGLDKIEKEHRLEKGTDYFPYANGVSYSELSEIIIPDQNGKWMTPLIFIDSHHNIVHGIDYTKKQAFNFLNSLKKEHPLDILSISARINDSKIELKTLVRPYMDFEEFKNLFLDFFRIMGDPIVEDVNKKEELSTGHIIVPDEIKNFHITEEEKESHDEKYSEQKQVFLSNSKEHPFLNSLEDYTPKKIPEPKDKLDLIYDLKTDDMKVKTVASYEDYTEVFREIMRYVNGIEKHHYYNAVKTNDKKEEDNFMNFLEKYIQTSYVKIDRLPAEDVPHLLKKLRRSLFQMYILQDLIDDDDVTDIKVTAPDSIRARIHGRAHITNICFVDADDYIRFINFLAIRNGISLKVPEQTFTDTSDPKNIMRLSITASYVNSVDWPYLHVRKISRNKMLSDDLMKAGMFTKKVRDYLLDCGKNSRGVVFAGRPGSGKTYCLNWFLEEAYEQEAEILVIQENDELFCYRKGVMFQHVVNYSTDGELTVNLEQLGQLALVAGANVFVIGEAKGAEICSAITLSNSGCRTAITIHSPSSTETIDKMADLAMRGYASDYEQAKRMLKSFQTIVYLEDFKVKEISEISGYDEENHCMTYNYIYDRNLDPEAIELDRQIEERRKAKEK